MTVTTVISDVNAALASNDRKTMANSAKQLNKDNNQHCPLT